MGCGASTAAQQEEKRPPAPPPATAAQQEEMLQAAAKTMVHICTQSAFDSVVKTEAKVAAPEDGTKYLKAVVDACRQMAGGAEDATKAKGEAAAAKVGEKGGKIGAAVGSIMSKAANVASKAAGAGANLVLPPIADEIQKRLEALDEAFSTVASDLVKANKAQLAKVYEDILNNCNFGDVAERVRGDDNKACSRQFMEVCGKMLKEQLLPPSQDFIDKSKAVKAWDFSIEKINDANAQIEKSFGQDSKMDVIKLDINEYVVDEVIKQITDAMETHEVTVRAAPDGKSTGFTVFCNPATFVTCFSQEPLLEKDYKAFKPS